MPAATAAPLARGQIQFLLKQARKIMFVLETRLHGDFFDGELGLRQEITGANKPQFEQVLVRPEPGVSGKSAPKPAVTDTELASQDLHVQVARVFILNASDRGFDDVGILRFLGRLRLLS